jgi:tRNA(fMet)-specific endonuclease VapC
MTRRCVLDTSAYSQLKRGHRKALRLVHDATHVLMPTIAIGELVSGFHQGPSPREHEAALEAFLAEPFVSVVDIDRAIAIRYGEVFADLRKRGRPIPVNDVWIAAVTLACDAELVTCDGDFDSVRGLRFVRLTA